VTDNKSEKSQPQINTDVFDAWLRLIVFDGIAC
jgi:hypothetical protein